jgi:hypothetical protein
MSVQNPERGQKDGGKKIAINQRQPVAKMQQQRNSQKLHQTVHVG